MYAWGGELAVEPHSSLSELLHRFLTENGIEDERLYGPKGLVRRVVELNPEISNADLIYPGMTIRIPSLKNRPASVLQIARPPPASPKPPVPVIDSRPKSKSIATPRKISVPRSQRWEAAVGYRRSAGAETIGQAETRSDGIGGVGLALAYENWNLKTDDHWTAEGGIVSRSQNESLKLGMSPWFRMGWGKPFRAGSAITWGIGSRVEWLKTPSSTRSGNLLRFEQRATFYAGLGPEICVAFQRGNSDRAGWRTCLEALFAPLVRSTSESSTNGWSSARGLLFQARIQGPAFMAERLVPELRLSSAKFDGQSPLGETGLNLFRAEIWLRFSIF